MPFRNNRAFTLIEILVVLAIMGSLAVLGVSRLNRTENLKTTIRQMSTVMKKTRAFAKLNGKTYRLVIRMDPKGPHTYWVESSNKMDPKANDKYKLSMDKEKEQENDGFQRASDILTNPKKIPGEWSFGRVESSGHPDSQETESAYVYFFPQGVSEEAVIQITNKNKTTWTLHLNPLISSPDVFEEAKSLKDFTK
jgi:prepilin-type N-terminal cleavage/methylation domain-containing protein